MDDARTKRIAEHLTLAYERGRADGQAQVSARKGMIPVEAKPTLEVLAADSKAQAEKATFDEGNYHEVEVESRWQILTLRATWSNALIIWISLLLLFEAGLSICIGFGWMNFEKHPYFLGSLVAQNIVQIIGMGLLIVRFLYPSRG